MPTAPLPHDEAARLAKLYAYNVLDTNPEEAFDDLTRLASQICGVPVALISLIDEERQWFKANIGLDAQETPRDVAFCAHAILQDNVMIVPDTLDDERFAENPLVTDQPNIRFYAGAPLQSDDGYNLGTLCVMDNTPRELRPDQIEALRILSQQVMAQLELRRYIISLAHMVAEREQIEETLQESQRMLRLVMDTIPQTIFWKDRNLNYLGCNAQFAKDAGLASPEDIIGKNDFDMPWSQYAELYRTDDFQIIESNTPKINFEEPITKADESQGWLRTSKIPLHDNEGKTVAVLGMYEDITALKQARDENIQLQAEIIRAQEAALAELSTPVIPISDQIMAMPLIGAIDSHRSQRALEALLEGVAKHSAQVVILDITGVPVVDTQVANSLIHAAQAVKLLGAKVVLTGIRPEVAQTFVGLGADLGGIITRSTLQSGIAFAINRY
ncbi:MAG: PAS domain-containing protein [Chloroflexales bacterium]|nr:PAS domain-containing protein [Chloroflexales bacterium]